MSVRFAAVGAYPCSVLVEIYLGVCGIRMIGVRVGNVAVPDKLRSALKICVSNAAVVSDSRCRRAVGSYRACYRRGYESAFIKLAAAFSAKICVVVIPCITGFTNHKFLSFLLLVSVVLWAK